jgi:hypothetical protein
MSKVEQIKEKYPSIPSRTINSLEKSDKTATKKYLDYMCFLWISLRNSKQCFELVTQFDSLLPYIENKDIYSPFYKDLMSLNNTINQAIITKEEKSFVREEHVNVIFENEDYMILIPKTHKGSLKYGASTKWCTASKNHPSTFTNYSNRGLLFYVIRKKVKGDLYDKVAFFINKQNCVFSEIEVFKSNDNRSQFRDLMGSSWDFEDIQNIVTTINLYSLYYERYDNAKNNIDKFVKQISNINTKDIEKSFKILGESDNNIGKLTESIKDLTGKISELKFTY